MDVLTHTNSDLHNIESSIAAVYVDHFMLLKQCLTFTILMVALNSFHFPALASFPCMLLYVLVFVFST